MNRLALSVTLALACSSSSMRSLAPDSGLPTGGDSGGNVVLPPPSGGSSGEGPGGMGGMISDGGDAAPSAGGDGGSVALPPLDVGADAGGGSASTSDSDGGNVLLPPVDGAADVAPFEAGAPVAEIVETESTNYAGFDVLVYGDGSAVQTTIPSRGCRYSGSDADVCQSSSTYYPPGTPIVMRFLADLQAVGDVSGIQSTWCGKSVSFGTYTRVSANGNTSNDLQCMANPTPAQCALYADCLALTSGPATSSIPSACP